MKGNRLPMTRYDGLVVVPSLSFYKLAPILLLLPYLCLVATVCYVRTSGMRTTILLSTCFPVSLIVYKTTPSLIIALKKGGFCNINLNAEDGAPKVPEPGSLWACTIYLLHVTILVAFSDKYSVINLFNGAILGIGIMTLLGINDDMIPLRYFTKISAPALAMTPVFMAIGFTDVQLMPEFTSKLFGLNIRYTCIYCLFKILLTIFFVNAINIHAGINGLEIGQSIIIALFLVLHSCIEIAKFRLAPEVASVESVDKHLMSLMLLLPFLSVNLGLICYNWYPASTFVGNIYTSMAGALFAVVGLVCECSLLMLLLFIPQLINFVVSIPQLIGILPCPRFRAPRYNAGTGLLEHTSHYTLLNMLLRALGPMSEQKLSFICLVAQVLCCFIGLSAYHCR
uniref:UDP-N-acetylglucosamine--dolichyl-phosphate N-acetylglucosaminephosphotransferase n=1 Tax=Babesia bovis TaxID=5865 RepID=S6BPN5_BABBO|nr:N-acetylglucosamine-1-phosphate transferase [Babesia bovis]